MLACTECHGEGLLSVSTCRRAHLPGCDCGEVDAKCSACRGSGALPCVLCAAPAVAWADLDTPVCGACLRAQLEAEWNAMLEEKL